MKRKQRDLPTSTIGPTQAKAVNALRAPRRAQVFQAPFRKTSPQAMRRRAKATVIAKALLAGKTQDQAALLAGCKPGTGLHPEAVRLAHSPDVREELELALDKYRLDADRAAKELDKGLRGGEMGKHDTYLQLFMRARRYLGNEPAPTGQTFNTVVLQRVYQNAVDRGLV